MRTQVQVIHDGQIEDAYETCSSDCAVLVMTWLGAPFEDCDTSGTVDLGEGVTLDCAQVGETEGDMHCAGCGDFIQHGLSCECPVIYGEKRDPESLGHPHINFRANV